MWTWSSFWENHFREKRKVVYLNMDESSCKLWTTPSRGFVTANTQKKTRAGQHQGRVVPLRRRREAFSLIAFLSDDEEIQKALPQFFILNKYTLSKADTESLAKCEHEAGVVLQRGNTAWLKAPELSKVLRHIGRTLSPWRKTHAFILCMDACPTHWTDKVARAAAENHLALVLIPPLTTCIFQPLDVHVFQHIKREARYGMESLQSRHPTGEIPARDIVEMWATCVRQTLNSRSWRFAFESCGFTRDMRKLGQRCRDQLTPNVALHFAGDLPSLAQLQNCSSSRTRLPIGWWFHLAQDAEEARAHTHPLSSQTEHGHVGSEVAAGTPIATHAHGALPASHSWTSPTASAPRHRTMPWPPTAKRLPVTPRRC